MYMYSIQIYRSLQCVISDIQLIWFIWFFLNKKYFVGESPWCNKNILLVNLHGLIRNILLVNLHGLIKNILLVNLHGLIKKYFCIFSAKGNNPDCTKSCRNLFSRWIHIKYQLKNCSSLWTLYMNWDLVW